MRTGPYRIGYSIPNNDDYGLVKLGPLLDEAESLSIDLVELPLYALDVVARGRVLPERLKKLKAITEGRSIGYTIHGPLGLNLLEQRDLLQIHKDVFKAMLEVAAELGGAHFVAHSGSIPQQTANPAPRFARQREILAEMGDVAAQSGMVIAVENLFGGPDGAMLPSRLAGELEAVGHPAVRACLDFSHAYLLCTKLDVDFIGEIAVLAPFAKHLHMHDSFGVLIEGAHFSYRAERVAYGVGDLHLPLGMGSIPWEAIFETCRFPEQPIFITELAPPYWIDLPEVIEKMRALAAKANIGAA
jgi:sugar phosphate isomerase/epimerase